MAKHNRRYKDSVFVDLFGEDKNAKARLVQEANEIRAAKALRTRTSREFSKGNSKLNEMRYFSGSFKLSLKCGIAGSVNFRKCRIGARASQRARRRFFFSRLGAVQARSFERRTRTSREFSKGNSQLNETRCFSGSFKLSYKRGITGSVNFRKCRIDARASQRIYDTARKPTDDTPYLDSRQPDIYNPHIHFHRRLL